jgi:hypothetical protein
MRRLRPVLGLINRVYMNRDVSIGPMDHGTGKIPISLFSLFFQENQRQRRERKASGIPPGKG